MNQPTEIYNSYQTLYKIIVFEIINPLGGQLRNLPEKLKCLEYIIKPDPNDTPEKKREKTHHHSQQVLMLKNAIIADCQNVFNKVDDNLQKMFNEFIDTINAIDFTNKIQRKNKLLLPNLPTHFLKASEWNKDYVFSSNEDADFKIELAKKMLKNWETVKGDLECLKLALKFI